MADRSTTHRSGDDALGCPSSRMSPDGMIECVVWATRLSAVTDEGYSSPAEDGAAGGCLDVASGGCSC